jgi:hypothetical protein
MPHVKSFAPFLFLGLTLPGASWAQSSFVPGSRTIFELDLSSVEPGQVPKQLRLLKGNLTLVQKDGRPMLRATTPTEFLIELPEVLPADFTVEFGLVPKVCCFPQDLSFEGSRTINQGIASAHILWDSHNALSIIGGAQDNYESPLAEELRTTLPGVPTQVSASFAGSTVKLYTNGQRMYTLEREFARGRVFRVFLGGSEGVEGAVHLASLRIASNMPAMRIAIAESDFVPGQRELYDLHTPPPPPPPPGQPREPFPSIRIQKGAWASVQKDGRAMRKVTKPTELVVSLLETLPRDFTVEIELVPKEAGPPPDLTLEGTVTVDQGPRSAHLLWQADGAVAVIGGAENDNYEQPMPEDFKVIMPGAPTRIALKFTGSTIKLYTNGRRLYTLTDRAFVRGKVLRVTLNAQDDGALAEYLAGLRIATDAPPPKPRP